MNAQFDLSIIIVNWNTRTLLEQCLNSVERSLQGSIHLTAETFVVDNASADGSVQMVREHFPEVKVVENTQNVGFARANNQAIQESQGHYIVLLNSDTELKSGALSALVAFMDAHPSVGAAGPYLLNGDGSTLQPSCYPVLTPWREFWRLSFLDRVIPWARYRMEQWDAEIPHEVEVIKGACLVLRHQALAQVGLLDERYFMYSEEMDLCHRLSQAGWKLYWVPEAKVIHYGEASSRQVAEAMYVELYQSKVQFQRKFGGARRARLFKLLITLVYLPRWGITLVGRLIDSRATTMNRTFWRLLTELRKM